MTWQGSDEVGEGGMTPGRTPSILPNSPASSLAGRRPWSLSGSGLAESSRGSLDEARGHRARDRRTSGQSPSRGAHRPLGRRRRRLLRRRRAGAGGPDRRAGSSRLGLRQGHRHGPGSRRALTGLPEGPGRGLAHRRRGDRARLPPPGQGPDGTSPLERCRARSPLETA